MESILNRYFPNLVNRDVSRDRKLLYVSGFSKAKRVSETGREAR